VHESPLGLFNVDEDGRILERTTASRGVTSPHHEPVGGQAPARVQRRHHQVPRRQAAPVGTAQIAVAKTEPGDENNQDISSLVGKIDIRKLELLPG
jgi:serine protein kinase